MKKYKNKLVIALALFVPFSLLQSIPVQAESFEDSHEVIEEDMEEYKDKYEKDYDSEFEYEEEYKHEPRPESKYEDEYEKEEKDELIEKDQEEKSIEERKNKWEKIMIFVIAFIAIMTLVMQIIDAIIFSY